MRGRHTISNVPQSGVTRHGGWLMAASPQSSAVKKDRLLMCMFVLPMCWPNKQHSTLVAKFRRAAGAEPVIQCRWQPSAVGMR